MYIVIKIKTNKQTLYKLTLDKHNNSFFFSFQTFITFEKNMEKNKSEWFRIDGLSNILRTNQALLKLFWLSIFLCSVSTCLYFLVNDVLTFAKFQVTTTYRLQSPAKAAFPTISICGIYTLNSEYYINLLEQTNTSVLKDVDAFYNFLSLESAYKNMTGKYFTQEQKISLFDWDGFVISCTFGSKECDPNNFGRFYFPYDLSCLVFNSGRDPNNSNTIPFEQVSVGGDTQSLTMELYVGLPNQISSIISSRGLLVRIMDSNEDLYKYSPSAIYISPGLATKISVKRKIYNRFNKWPYLYNECTVNKDGTLMKPLVDYSLYDYAVSTNFTYSRDSCLFYLHLFLGMSIISFELLYSSQDHNTNRTLK